MIERTHRSGVVALLGRPNAGKSALLNRLVGEKLAIVTDKPQTTRSRLLGILTRPDAQLLLVDTPGIHHGERTLNQAMIEALEQAARDCDVAVLLVDPGRGFGDDHRAWLARLARGGKPVLLVATKQDLPERASVDWPPVGAPPVRRALRISTRTGEGLDELLRAVVESLPIGPPRHAEDELTDRPLRFLVAELVREAAFESLHEEVPYALAVEVVRFDESDPERVRIDANLLVERASQKGIVIGAGGSMIRGIGTRARREIQRLVGKPVHLSLWVKVEPRWSKRLRRLKALGYH